jgi:uncharacterized protein YicC (UPF0701 family)
MRPAPENRCGHDHHRNQSVNSRFLDLQFRINDDFRSVESLFRDAISRKLAARQVECRFSFGKNHRNQ